MGIGLHSLDRKVVTTRILDDSISAGNVSITGPSMSSQSNDALQTSSDLILVANGFGKVIAGPKLRVDDLLIQGSMMTSTNGANLHVSAPANGNVVFQSAAAV